MADNNSNQSISKQDLDSPESLGISIAYPQRGVDFATLFGVISSIALIVFAIYIGHSKANFFNLPSVLIVILGTIAVTSVSYNKSELSKLGSVLKKTLFSRKHKPALMAKQLLDLATISRKKGVLALSELEPQLRREPFLHKAIQMVTDGFSGDDIEKVLMQEVDSLTERHRKCSSIIRRASEVAPAMGLIGTLVGLVQMLAELDNPESIGPSMAVALLTTFYGAIMGTVFLSPLAIKLDRNSDDETMINNLIVTASSSIARQENPRRLEMILNSELPPSERIRYFD